jgi:hypothetical protein
VHLSTGSSTQGFDLQNASLNQGGWATEGWWVAADMDDDGLDDMVSVFGDGSGGDLNVDVHSSRVQGFSVGNAAGFVLQRYSSLIANRFYTPSPTFADRHLLKMRRQGLRARNQGEFAFHRA